MVPPNESRSSCGADRAGAPHLQLRIGIHLVDKRKSTLLSRARQLQALVRRVSLVAVSGKVAFDY